MRKVNTDDHEEKNIDFLIDASLLYKERCPELSRFLMQGPLNVKASFKMKSYHLLQQVLVCPFCYQWFQPNNHRVRLRPKQRPSARVQSILLRKARGKRLSLAQKELLRRFQNSSSVLMATCHTCNKTSRHKGANRDVIATFSKTHSTPGSTGKRKTPQGANRASTTTPKSAGKEKTPCNTPSKSSSSNTPGSGSSSSKTPSKAKNWVVQRLSKILIREDNQGSKKGGLKDFLSSL
ncbi:UPF0711 protein C18orf21 homolog [Myripristis murdjan]|uniref:Si:dkey-184p18.2 n=1 Tax=Myripristis murdjan TaxID=586833 RepID=A0A668AZ68_9TELE|nr:UPF0711 protein C18orf21 homolog [Myripristis murdjan]